MADRALAGKRLVELDDLGAGDAERHSDAALLEDADDRIGGRLRGGHVHVGRARLGRHERSADGRVIDREASASPSPTDRPPLESSARGWLCASRSLVTSAGQKGSGRRGMAGAVDLVVVGGGITGTSAALHAARRGLSVQLFERAAIAAVQSGHSAGMIGTHRGSRIKVELSVEAMPIWSRFGETFGTDAAVFSQTGRLYLYGPELEASARAAMALQTEFGRAVRIVNRRELAEIEPRLDPGDATLIVWEPDAGIVDPPAATRAVAAAARRAGAEIREGVAVFAIETVDGRVAGVRTAEGRVDCGAVLVATSAWAPVLLRPLGVEVPIDPRPAPALYLRRAGGDGSPHRTVSDLVGTGYARDIGSGISMVGGEPESDVGLADADMNVEAASWATVQRLKAHFGRLFPAYRNSVVLGANTGLYDVTPDGHPVVDRVPGAEGAWVIAGFSGDGFKYGPVLGRLLAEWLVDGAPSIDLRALRLARFAEGDLIPPEFPGVAFEGTSRR